MCGMGVDEVDTLVQFAGCAGWCMGLAFGFVLGGMVRVRGDHLQAAHDAATLRKRGVL